MRRMVSMSAAAAALIVGAQAAVAQQAPVPPSLTSIPDNAVLFIKINNLEQASKKMGKLCQAWGLAAVQPMLGDPLTALKGMTNVDKGVNQAGEGAVIIFNRLGHGQGDPVLFMVPVSDYKVFLGNFEGAQTDGEITNITLPMNQQPGYMTSWGSFAAISTDRSLVAEKPAATKAKGLSAKELTGRDLVAYVNFPAIKQQANMGLGFGQMMLIGQIDQKASQDTEMAKYAPLAKAAAGQLFKGLGHFINETQAMTVGLSLSDAGVQATWMTEFLPTSYLGGLVQQYKPEASDVTVGLAPSKYALVGGAAIDGKTLSMVLDDAAGPVVLEAQKLGEDGQPIVAYIDSIKQLWQATKTQSFGMRVGDGKAGSSALFDFTAVMQGDADKILESQTKMAQSQEKFQQMLQIPGQMKTQTTLLKKAKTLDGVTFDQITTAPATTQPSGPQQKVIEAFYGEGGFAVLMGAVTPQALLATSSKQDAQISAAIAAAKAGKPLAWDAATQTVAGKLPANGFFSMYLYGDQMLGLASKASEVFTGVPLQMQLPPNTPPVGMAASTDGSAIRGDLFVPSELVQSVSAMVMQQAVKQHQDQQKDGGL